MDLSILNSLFALHDEVVDGLQRAAGEPADVGAKGAQPGLFSETMRLLRRADQAGNAVRAGLSAPNLKPDARITDILRAAAAPLAVNPGASRRASNAAAEPSAIKLNANPKPKNKPRPNRRPR